MSRTERLASEPVSGMDLQIGILSALQLYMGDVNFDRFVGETGRIICTVELQLNAGRVQWTDGAVAFRRRIV